jgi:hypothetical protein
MVDMFESMGDVAGRVERHVEEEGGAGEDVDEEAEINAVGGGDGEAGETVTGGAVEGFIALNVSINKQWNT